MVKNFVHEKMRELKAVADVKSSVKKKVGCSLPNQQKLPIHELPVPANGHSYEMG